MRDRLACLELLGLPHEASRSDIRQAYLEQAKQCHPDRGARADTSPSAERFRAVHQAYTTLVAGDDNTAGEPFDAEVEGIHPTLHEEKGWTLDGDYVERSTKLVRGKQWVVHRIFAADGSYARRVERSDATGLLGEKQSTSLPQRRHTIDRRGALEPWHCLLHVGFRLANALLVVTQFDPDAAASHRYLTTTADQRVRVLEALIQLASQPPDSRP